MATRVVRFMVAVMAVVLGAGALSIAPAAAAGSGTISGTVTQGLVGPVAGVSVLAYSPTYGSVVASATTAANGAYALSGLDATDFKVQFVPPAGKGASEWYAGQNDFASATVVSVASGATVVANLQLAPPANLPLFLDGTGATLGNQLPGSPGCTDPVIPRPSAAACAGLTLPNYWASINGPYEHHANGDPYATRCWGNGVSSTACTNPASGADVQTNVAPPGGHAELNPAYRPDGYLYAVDVKAPGTLTVEIYDAAYDARQSNTVETGDNCGTCGTDAKDGPTTEFTLYDASGSLSALDPTPANALKAKGACTGTDLSGAPATGTLVAAPAGKSAVEGGTQTPTVYKNRWTSLCTLNVSSPGVYPLRVRADDIPGLCTFTNVWTADGCSGAGQNSFALRATGSAVAEMHAIDAASMYTNFNYLTTTFKVAEVDPAYAGQTLVFDIFDIGDVSGNATIQLLPPPDAAGNPVAPLPCSWVRSTVQGGPSNGMSGSGASGCSIQSSVTGQTMFNNQWLRVRIPLPANYSCAPGNCRWNVAEWGISPHDHVTWRAKIASDLSGTVTNAFGVRFPNVPVAVIDAAGVQRGSTVTDANGDWSFQLLAGSYRVRIGSLFSTAVQWYPAQPTSATATALAIAPGTDVVANEVLRSGGALTGTVTDGTNPLAGIAAIVITDAATPGIAATVITDASGHFTVSHLMPGSYKVLFVDTAWSVGSTNGYLPAFNGSVAVDPITVAGLLTAYAAATPIAVTASTTTTGADASLLHA